LIGVSEQGLFALDSILHGINTRARDQKRANRDVTIRLFAANLDRQTSKKSDLKRRRKVVKATKQNKTEQIRTKNQHLRPAQRRADLLAVNRKTKKRPKLERFFA
jgi:hypothetical protein